MECNLGKDGRLGTVLIYWCTYIHQMFQEWECSNLIFIQNPGRPNRRRNIMCLIPCFFLQGRIACFQLNLQFRKLVIIIDPSLILQSSHKLTISWNVLNIFQMKHPQICAPDFKYYIYACFPLLIIGKMVVPLGWYQTAVKTPPLKEPFKGGYTQGIPKAPIPRGPAFSGALFGVPWWLRVGWERSFQ